MAARSTRSQSDASLFNQPSNPVGYLAILAALVTAVVHLLLTSRIMQFNQTLGILFLLNGLGFLGGTILYVTRFWRRELLLVAAGYAIITVVAFFYFQGFGLDAFYMRGDLNPMAVVAKVAEVVVAACTLYLYSETGA